MEAIMKFQKHLALAAAVFAVALLPLVTAVPAATAEDDPIADLLEEAHKKFKGVKEGKNADYIPALAEVPSKLFGISLVTVDGRVYDQGDTKSLFSIQSISKVFTLALALQESGEQAIEDNIGVDATGQVFNSIVAVEQYKGAEMNAMVNPGAITATSMVKGATRDEIWNSILNWSVLSWSKLVTNSCPDI